MSFTLPELSVAIAAVTLLIVLYRWVDGFASKKEVKEANVHLEEVVTEHRLETRTLVSQAVATIGARVDGVLEEVRDTSARVRDLEGWTESHEKEDKSAHGVIAEVRDFMARPRPVKLMIAGRASHKGRGAQRKRKARAQRSRKAARAVRG